ncbi:MAG: hypothetical protein ACYDB9_02070 [Gammaproteobacteria bacterium]
MSVHTVIDIDVNDEHFKRFTDLFNKYRDAVAKQPEAWKKVGASTKSTRTNFETMAAALMAQSHLARETGRSADQSNKTLSRQQSLWNTIHRSTTGVFKNVVGIAKLLTEMGIGLGLGALGFGVGSLFGLLGMAKSADSSRKFAQQTGTTIGQRFAFNKYEGSHLDNPEGILAQANLANSIGSPMFNLARALHFSTLGGTFAVANRALLAIQRKMHEPAYEQNKGLLMMEYGKYLRAAGFDQADLNVLQSRTRAHQEALTNQGIIESHAAHLGDSAQWTASLRVFESTLKNLGVTLKNDLVPLMPHVDKFLTAAGKDLGNLLKSPVAKKALSDLAAALNRFTNFVSSGGFVAALKEIGDDIHDYEVAKHIVTFPERIQLYTAKKEYDLGKYLVGKGEVGYNYLTHDPAKAVGAAQTPSLKAAGYHQSGSIPVDITAHSHIHLKITKPAGSNIHAAVNAGH